MDEARSVALPERQGSAPPKLIRGERAAFASRLPGHHPITTPACDTAALKRPSLRSGVRGGCCFLRALPALVPFPRSARGRRGTGGTESTEPKPRRPDELGHGSKVVRRMDGRARR